MNAKKVSERQLILQLALQESYRKRNECQSGFNDLNNKISVMTADGCSFSEKDKIMESMVYLKNCRDGWQDTINHIRDWQDELKS